MNVNNALINVVNMESSASSDIHFESLPSVCVCVQYSALYKPVQHATLSSAKTQHKRHFEKDTTMIAIYGI